MYNLGTEFIVQRFKPLPSIGSTNQMQSGVASADSAVDLTSPSPPTSTTEIKAPSLSTRTVTLRSDRKHSHMNNSRSSSREGRSATKAAKIDTKPLIVTTSQAKAGDESRVVNKRTTRGTSKSKLKSKPPPPSELNFEVPPEPSQKDAPHHKQTFEVPPEPSYKDVPHHKQTFEVPPEPPKDAPHTVVLKLRLPGGECIQRRFNYQVDLLGCVVSFTCAAMSIQGGSDLNLTMNNVTLSSNGVPKVVYSDLSLTLEQAGLVHNTLLHLDCEDQ